MKKHLVWVAALAMLASVAVWAADIDGTWSREVQGKQGPAKQTLKLKSSGNKLTGTMEGGGGRGGAMPAEISDGTVEGANVSFKIVRDFGGNSVTQQFKGTVSATELKLTQEFAGGGPGGGGGGFGKGPGGGKGGPQEMVFKKE